MHNKIETSIELCNNKTLYISEYSNITDLYNFGTIRIIKSYIFLSKYIKVKKQIAYIDNCANSDGQAVSYNIWETMQSKIYLKSDLKSFPIYKILNEFGIKDVVSERDEKIDEIINNEL